MVRPESDIASPCATCSEGPIVAFHGANRAALPENPCPSTRPNNSRAGARASAFGAPGATRARRPGLAGRLSFRHGGREGRQLHARSQAAGRSFVRFDYFGHGESSGAFADGTIGRWRRCPGGDRSVDGRADGAGRVIDGRVDGFAGGAGAAGTGEGIDVARTGAGFHRTPDVGAHGRAFARRSWRPARGSGLRLTIRPAIPSPGG